MQRLTATRVRALAESLRRLDLLTAQALVAHAEWLESAERALREANIQLAAPQLQTTTVAQLRDRIDVLLDVVPRPVSRDED